MVKISENVEIKFPLKLKPRDQQIEAFNFARDSINNGNKYCLLNMTTGAGKSYFALMFINWYLNYINKKAKIDILTNSKILQDQYTNEFPFMKAYKGKSNYRCQPHDTDCSNGKNICKVQGPNCDDCPYDLAKKAWQESTIGLTNFHLFNTVALYVETILETRGPNVLIIDEAHDFESVFCDFISTSLSSKSLKSYGFDLKEIEDLDTQIGNIKTIHQYIGFVENQFINNLTDKINWLEYMKKESKGKTKQEYSKYLVHSEGQLFKFKYLIKEFSNNPSNWILDITKTKDKMYSGVLLEAKPVWGHEYIKEHIFDKYDHVIFLSATLLNKEMISYINGLETGLTTYFETSSTFPVNRRPIYYMKLGKMSYKYKDETLKIQLKYIKQILKKHKNEKGIIHTINYENLEYIKNNIVNKRLLFTTPENRNEIIEKHTKSKEPTFLVSPSLMNGIDLKDDLSRAQVIMKVPYPYLGSEKIKMRQKTKPEWYIWKSIIDFIQMYGRSIRSVEDYATTYVLDSNFSDLLKYNGNKIPKYITDAIKILRI